MVFNCPTGVNNTVQSGMESIVYNVIVVISTIGFMGAFVVGGAKSDDIRYKFGNRVPMILLGAIIAGIRCVIFPILTIGSNMSYIMIIGSIIFVNINIGLGFALAPDML